MLLSMFLDETLNKPSLSNTTGWWWLGEEVGGGGGGSSKMMKNMKNRKISTFFKLVQGTIPDTPTTLYKECIFERFGTWIKNSENISFQLQKLLKLEDFHQLFYSKSLA